MGIDEIDRLRDALLDMQTNLASLVAENETLRAESEALREALREAIDWNWLDDDRPEDLFQKYFSMSAACAARGEK